MKNRIILLFFVLVSKFNVTIGQFTINTIKLSKVEWQFPNPSDIQADGTYSTNAKVLTLFCKATSGASLEAGDFTVTVNNKPALVSQAFCNGNVFSATIHLDSLKNHEIEISVKKGKTTVSTPVLKVERVKRFALLVANAKYTNSSMASLQDVPLQDVKILKEALTKLDFNVVVLENQGRLQMIDSLDAFVQKAAQSNMLFFYYSGHGIQSAGNNFIVPVDARFNTRNDVSARAIEVRYILDKLDEALPKAKIIVLDACRNEGFPVTNSSTRDAGTRGFSTLLPVADSGIIDTFLVNATQPNQTAQNNGLFAKELAKQLKRGTNVSDVFRQVRVELKRQANQEPELNDKLSKNIVF